MDAPSSTTSSPIDRAENAPALPKWLESLNPQQRHAATFDDRPLLIIAGAGTGKTNTLAHRVAWLIRRGVDPGRILLLTFTRRAAAQMMRRVGGILATAAANGYPAAQGQVARIWGGTFHAMAHRLLCLHGRSLGLGDSFGILDRSDAEDLLDAVRCELGLDRSDVRFPKKGTCLAIYSRCVNAQRPVEQALEQFPWCNGFGSQLNSLFKAYTERKGRDNVLDYDDLLLYWDHLMQHESLAEQARRRFDAVLVDEYQDTNLLQAAILKRLVPDGRGLTVVGDDAQSIYSFRAATVANILDFPKAYANAAVVTLEQNYRSVQPILDASNGVMALAAAGFRKNLFSARSSGELPHLATLADEDAQTQYLIARILEHREAGIVLRKQAVLFRAAHHSDALEVELGRRNIPFVKYGGLKFLEAAHVKDVLALLRVAENPRDSISAFRVFQMLDGVGPAHARRAISALEGGGYRIAALADFSPPPSATNEWRQMLSMYQKLESATALGVQIAAVREFYAPILTRRYDNAAVRLRDLDQLEVIADSFSSRAALLAGLTLDPLSATQDLAGVPFREEDYLILSTIHSAKGCEWDCVYVLHATDGNIPSDMACGSTDEIEEERRLFYVALTRARDHLEVLVPLRYYARKWGSGDRHAIAQMTRFIPPSLYSRFERVTWPPVPAPRPGKLPDPGQFAVPAYDVRAAIAGRWT
jgi:DNA helicase II / ATP-dependent DNA helicase PcrA